MNTAIALIKQFEGYSADAYPDPSSGDEPWTIGYGTTVYSNGKPVKRGDVIDRRTAEFYLRDEVDRIVVTLQQTIPKWVELTNNEQSALISFAYNVGTNFYGADGFDSITKMLKDGFGEPLKVFGLYTNQGLAGLVARRQVEAELFMKDVNTKMPNLAVPYLSQLDNQERPYGSCNVTSVAMCLKFLHPDRNYGCPPNVQLEDFLFRLLETKGKSRHDPYDLQWLIQYFGVKDDFRPDSKWGDAKKHLDAGKPLIVHGFFTASGHIIVIRGYSGSFWKVNDPYGEFFPNGYDTSKSGANLDYSDSMMRKCCGVDGDLWLHFVG